MYLPLEFCFRVAFPKPIRNPFLLTCSEVVRDGLALHKDFKGAVAAGCEIHGVASFLNLGIKNGVPWKRYAGHQKTPRDRLGSRQKAFSVWL